MNAKKWLMLFINLLGGGGVIGSYLWGFLTHPNAGQALWGGVPDSIQPFYTAGMVLAATGYFAFTYFILFRLNPSETRVFNRFPYGLFNVLYAAILIPSALWMPLTEASPSETVTIRRVHELAEANPQVIAFLEEKKLMPGMQVSVEEILPFNQTISLSVEGQTVTLGFAIARMIFIEQSE